MCRAGTDGSVMAPLDGIKKTYWRLFKHQKWGYNNYIYIYIHSMDQYGIYRIHNQSAWKLQYMPHTANFIGNIFDKSWGLRYILSDRCVARASLCAQLVKKNIQFSSLVQEKTLQHHP